MFAQGKITTDRNVIEKWAKARHGWPAIVRTATNVGVEMALSIVFPDGEDRESANKISWEEFFEKFDQQNLVFMYREKDPNQKLSRYFVFM